MSHSIWPNRSSVLGEKCMGGMLCMEALFALMVRTSSFRDVISLETRALEKSELDGN